MSDDKVVRGHARAHILRAMAAGQHDVVCVTSGVEVGDEIPVVVCPAEHYDRLVAIADGSVSVTLIADGTLISREKVREAINAHFVPITFMSAEERRYSLLASLGLEEETHGES